MLSLPIKPHIRLVLLSSVGLVLFFLVVNLLNTLASQNVQLNQLERQTAAQRSEQNNYRDDAVRSLNEELVVKSNGETLQRVNTDELIKIRNITNSQQEAQKPAQNTSSNPNQIVSR